MRVSAMTMRTPTLVEAGPGGPKIPASPGSNLFDLLKDAGLPLASACDGEGVCGRCAVELLEGAELLSPLDPLEERVLVANQVAPGWRLACLTTLTHPGLVRLDVPYWPRRRGAPSPSRLKKVDGHQDDHSEHGNQPKQDT